LEGPETLGRGYFFSPRVWYVAIERMNFNRCYDHDRIAPTVMAYEISCSFFLSGRKESGAKGDGSADGFSQFRGRGWKI